MATPMWRGVFPAVTTKFTIEGKRNKAEMERCFALQFEDDVDGMIVCGSLGEVFAIDSSDFVRLPLSGAERQRVMTVIEKAFDPARSFQPCRQIKTGTRSVIPSPFRLHSSGASKNEIAS